jgi:hypothetical protein
VRAREDALVAVRGVLALASAEAVKAESSVTSICGVSDVGVVEGHARALEVPVRGIETNCDELSAGEPSRSSKANVLPWMRSCTVLLSLAPLNGVQRMPEML